ncbi:membrane protein insertase YidC, partial [Streptomyces sp900105245]
MRLPVAGAVRGRLFQFHAVYGAIFGPDTGWAWGLSIVSLVILIRI